MRQAYKIHRKFSLCQGGRGWYPLRRRQYTGLYLSRQKTLTRAAFLLSSSFQTCLRILRRLCRWESVPACKSCPSADSPPSRIEVLVQECPVNDASKTATLSTASLPELPEAGAAPFNKIENASGSPATDVTYPESVTTCASVPVFARRFPDATVPFIRFCSVPSKPATGRLSMKTSPYL